jgi:protocatechuate 3,4-dioxygenase beta subunit
MLPGVSDMVLTRRRVLAWLGGLGLAALIPGCADEGDSAAPSTTTAATTTTATTATTVDCVLSPEQTEGPYYVDLDLVRRDITEGRPGAPLDLTVKVVDGESCEPIADAAVDIWHCDAEGVYSGVQGDDGTFLRGVQMADAGGEVVFRTIYPGWYTGRAVHIHVKVQVGGAESYTGQLYFDAAVTDDVYGTEPYNARPGPDTSNEADGIFGRGGDQTVVSVSPGGDGYRGAVTLGVLRT